MLITLKAKFCVNQLAEANSRRVLEFFKTLRYQMYFHISSANPCPSGRNPQINPATNQATLCAFGGTGAPCAIGYTCAFSSTASNYYCCSPVGSIL